MKKIVATTFCILMLCSLLLITVGTAMAAEPGYERISYSTQVEPTIDGMWTSEDEWTDGDVTWIGTDVAFRSTWDDNGTYVMTRWIVEFFSDTTDDPNDSWLFCIDATQAGGSVPQLGRRMFEILGHTDLIWYIGTEQGQWSDDSPMLPNEIEWANSLSASPTNWPPTDPDIPDTWGIENYSTEPIPEFLTFAVMALLSTVSMLVGYKYFVKRKETKAQ